MGEARRRKLLGLKPKSKKRKKTPASCKGTFQTQGMIHIPGLRV